MIFGAITNSWRHQLQTTDLKDLVAKAEAFGARHIELRQTCLGDYETGEGDEWRPVVTRLRALVDASPDLGFNLAVSDAEERPSGRRVPGRAGGGQSRGKVRASPAACGPRFL